MTSAHTPGPWDTQGSDGWDSEITAEDGRVVICTMEDLNEDDIANARLIVAAPDMLAALKSVNKLISEAAMTGFNYADGDWPERLFFSQQATSDAIAKAEGRR